MAEHLAFNQSTKDRYLVPLPICFLSSMVETPTDNRKTQDRYLYKEPNNASIV